MKKILIVLLMIAAAFSTAFADRARLKELVELEIETNETIDLEEFSEIVSEMKERQASEAAVKSDAELEALEDEKERLRDELEQLERELEDLADEKASIEETETGSLEERARELVKEAMEDTEFTFEDESDDAAVVEVVIDPVVVTVREVKPVKETAESVDFAPMHISVVPGLNFPFWANHRVSTPLALSPIISSVYDVRGLQVSGAISIAEGAVSGSQWSGVGNIVEGQVNGVQGAGAFNITGGHVNGIQLAGVFNIAPKGVKGFQGSGAFNIVDGNVAGAQFSGVFNTVDGNLTGCQGAGAFNISEGDTSWLQMAGVLNISGGVMRGLQLAGATNIAHQDVQGFQIASVLNMAGDVNGGQIGLVNIGKNVKGVQVGLVNISEDIQGVPIGLINISKSGIFNITGWVDTTGFSYVGLQQGIGGIYWLAYAGGNTGIDFSTFKDFTAGIGGGFQQNWGPFVIDTDISAKYAFEKKEYNSENHQGYYYHSDVIPSARVAAGIQLGDRLGIYAGASFDAYLPGLTEDTGVFASGDAYSFTLAGQPVNLFSKYFVAIKL